MNIWLIQPSEPMPNVNKGERLLRMGMLAEELNKRNHKITWFSSTFNHFKKEQIYTKDTIINISENYKLYLIHAPKYKKNISVSRIINHKVIGSKFWKLTKKIEKPDLIYVSFPTIDSAEKAVKYGKKYNIPVIVDIRDLWPDIFYHNLYGVKKIIAIPYIKYMEFKTKKIMKDAFAINAISEAIVEWGLNKGNREKKQYDRFFYIGYTRKKDEKNINFENKNLINENKFNISFFGTINNQFDYSKIIDIAKILEEKDKEIVINICGDGPQYKELNDKTKNISNIKLLGWKNKEELNYILNNSDIGLAPYKNTFDFNMGVSNKFAEYISYGLPILLTSQGYMKELIEKNKCGFSSQKEEELCEFILNLKNDKNKYEIMSKNAKDLYKEKFDAEKIYKDLADYIENIKEEFQI